MIIALAVAAAQTLSATNYSVNAPMHSPAGAPAWSDEFSGSTLDGSKWSFDTSRNKVGWFNGELQYYSADRPQNLRLEDGKLIIEARKDGDSLSKLPDWGGEHYSSAKIDSRGKASFRYGFVEVRAKLPCAVGTWPAIWMMPEGSDPWPEGGEIDIMEQVGAEPNLIYSTLHTKAYNHTIGTQRSAQRPVASSCSAFHRYQLDWRPDVITIGVDGRGILRHRRQPTDGMAEWPFDRPFDLIINLAIGGDWASQKGIDDAALPQRMEVDYVRVWQSLPHSQRR
jgi:beta-glucanase (GH16 family)